VASSAGPRDARRRRRGRPARADRGGRVAARTPSPLLGWGSVRVAQASPTVGVATESLGNGGVDNVTRAIKRQANIELTKLEGGITFLATTGSTCPFIGLFGTVWGVMDAFSGLGTAGAASLRIVAPGIAEALITTAAGLATAIPAVIAYNHFLHNIKELGARMDNFALEVAAMIEKQYL
jgi:biopolymer transport protein ExbB/TolQ